MRYRSIADRHGAQQQIRAVPRLQPYFAVSIINYDFIYASAYIASCRVENYDKLQIVMIAKGRIADTAQIDRTYTPGGANAPSFSIWANKSLSPHLCFVCNAAWNIYNSKTQHRSRRLVQRKAAFTPDSVSPPRCVIFDIRANGIDYNNFCDRVFYTMLLPNLT